MSIYISGLDMPTNEEGWRTFMVYPDGTVFEPNWQGDRKLIVGAEAQQIGPHGKLCDADAFERHCMFNPNIEDMQDVIYALRDYPPTIEAERGADG